jgi:hypothetical protein
MIIGRKVLTWIKTFQHIDTERAVVRRFGLVAALFFAVASLVIFFKHRHPSVLMTTVSLLFLLLAIVKPAVLKYIYITSMRVACALSWLNIRLLLCIMFYFVFSFVGVLMRVFRIDLLDRSLEPDSDSYWKCKDIKGPSDYSKQF